MFPFFSSSRHLAFRPSVFWVMGQAQIIWNYFVMLKNSPHWTVGQITPQLPRAHQTASFCCLQSNLIVSTDTLFLPENDTTHAQRKTHSLACFCLLLCYHMQTLSLLMFYRLFLRRGAQRETFHHAQRFTLPSFSESHFVLLIFTPPGKNVAKAKLR